MVTYFLNTFLGFLFAQIYDIMMRDKDSKSSPKKFNFLFFLKDNYFKIIMSLLLSFVASSIFFFNVIIEEDSRPIFEIFSLSFDLINLTAVLIGSSPELLLQILKKKYGVFQPSEVDGYERN